MAAMRPAWFNAALAAALLTALPAGAGFMDNFGDWSAFADGEGKTRLCYMASAPTKAEGDYTKRGEMYALVTHRTADGSVGVVSIEAGYTYKTDSEVMVTIGDSTFSLFTDKGQAWARDRATDKALVDAMRAGATMVVKGTSSRGTLTTDTYSLNGFTAAYRAISKACGVK